VRNGALEDGRPNVAPCYLHGARRCAVVVALVAPLVAGGVAQARPGDLDLEDDAKPAPAQGGGKGTEQEGGGFGEYKPPAITVRAHAYTLSECLAMADRNHPNLWAARARLAFVHAQLDEAKWTPFWQWNAQALGGVLPSIGGTAFYNASPASALNTDFFGSYQPFFRFDINGVIPLYTFGKIESIRRAAEANVRVNEWDLEKARQQARMDVRRAYFGLMLARDARYVVDEVLKYLDNGIKGVREKLDRGDTAVEDVDRLRLEVYRDEIIARAGEAQKGETFALAALRFLTGVQNDFDIPDEPLKKPSMPLGPVVRYLAAARLFRPDVNMARAGVMARKAQLDFARAQYFPDVGLGLSASYSTAPSAVIQNNAWVVDPFNRFGFGAAIGIRWGLDLLPKAARVGQAESQLEETRALERLALGGIAVEVENAYATAHEAMTREEAWGRAEHRSKQWISTVQDAIDVGTKDERALTEPLRAFVNARVSHMYALMDFNVAMSDLARVSGWDAAAPN